MKKAKQKKQNPRDIIGKQVWFEGKRWIVDTVSYSDPNQVGLIREVNGEPYTITVFRYFLSEENPWISLAKQLYELTEDEKETFSEEFRKTEIEAIAEQLEQGVVFDSQLHKCLEKICDNY